ncbi:MAG: conjugal transfer protein TraB, partial [Nitrospinae bacterium CG11_big_fil_rev_8_21_14_0_20_56_8]
MKTVRYENSTITLIGTAHVSKKSVELVEETIGNGDFDCIAVELCKPRYEKLTHQTDWKELDIYQIIRQKKATLLLVNLALAAYQKRLADKLGIEPGKEMMRAVELAGEKGVRLELVDRDITTTLNRLVRNVTFWQKMKILAGLVTSIFVDEEIDEKKIEDLKNGDMLHSVVEEFGEELPQVKEVLIDERDEYMAGKLIQLTRLESAPKNILALVGAGHLAGMVQAFSNPADSERMVELDRKKPPSRVGYYVGWGICFVVLSLFYVGYRQSPDLGLQLLLTWVVINGGL